MQHCHSIPSVTQGPPRGLACTRHHWHMHRGEHPLPALNGSRRLQPSRWETQSQKQLGGCSGCTMGCELCAQAGVCTRVYMRVHCGGCVCAHTEVSVQAQPHHPVLALNSFPLEQPLSLPSAMGHCGAAPAHPSSRLSPKGQSHP